MEVVHREMAEMLSTWTINATSIIPLTVALMQLAERPRWRLGGIDKKQLVLRVLGQYVDKVQDNELRISLVMLLQLTVPDLIDTLASVSNGEQVIKGGCFRRLMDLWCGTNPHK
jgi:hypothetical protein